MIKILLLFYIAILLINFCNFPIECANFCIIFKSNVTNQIITTTSNSLKWINQIEKYEDSFGIISIDVNCTETTETLNINQIEWLLNVTTEHYVKVIKETESFMFTGTTLSSIVFCLFLIYSMAFKFKFY